MSSSVILTTSGASFMATAGTMFPALPIRYALLAYDFRIDPYVMPTSGMSNVSAVDSISAVGLGSNSQIIYNIDTLATSAYSISNNDFLLYDPNQSGTTTITNNRFDGTSPITLLNGIPLANSISATSIVYNYPNWTVNGYQLVNGSNVVPTGYANLRDRFFRVNSFAPISCAAGGLSNGLFKVLIDNQKGNFKFNKILLYAARILAGGIEDTSIEPVLVGIAYLNSPVIKSNDGSNLNFFEADIEVRFSANNYFGNVSYLSNNNFNYVGGEQLLWFDGKVAIGTSAIPGSWLGRAKLQITENNPVIPFIRITNDNEDSFVDTYLAETFYQNEQTIKSSKPVFYNRFETSGSSNKSSISFTLDHVNANRGINTSFVDATSGAINTGWFSSYGGYLETSYFTFDSNVLATFRSANNLYSTLVLGRDSINYFEHPNKFLTVHGGTLLVGSNLISGTNDINVPSLSANGYIVSNNLYVKNNTLIDGNLNLAGDFNHGAGVSYLGTTQFETSADFFCDVKVFGDITSNANMNTVNLVASSLISAPSIWASDSALVGLGMSLVGPGGLLTCQNLGVSTSAHFKGAVTFGNNLNVVGDIAGANISSNTLYTTALNGIAANFSSYISTVMLLASGNINVSGLAAFGSNINIDNGDLLIRGLGRGIKINTTGSDATAGRTAGGGGSSVNIITTAVAANSIIIYSTEGGGAFASNLLSRTPGSHFTVSFPSPPTWVNWIIINPTP